MGSKIKPRQQRSKKRIVPLRAGHDPRIVPLRIKDEEHERDAPLEHGWNVGHTADEEWR